MTKFRLLFLLLLTSPVYACGHTVSEPVEADTVERQVSTEIPMKSDDPQKAVFPIGETFPVKGAVDEGLCANIMTIQLAKIDCADCQEPLEKILAQRSEIMKSHFNTQSGELTLVIHKGQRIEERSLKQNFARAGYRIVTLKKGCP